jgi:hypothetical protein
MLQSNISQLAWGRRYPDYFSLEADFFTAAFFFGFAATFFFAPAPVLVSAFTGWAVAFFFG